MSIQIIITDPAELPAAEVERLIAYLESHLARLAPIEEATRVFPAPVAAESHGVHGGEGSTLPAPPAPPEPLVPPQPSVVPPAPVAPPAPPRPPRSTDHKPEYVELDAAGLPWDGRIHATTKAKLVDGHWKLRRSVDPAVVSQVIEELEAVMGAPVIVAVAAGVAAEVTVAVPPPAVPAGALTFPAFMQKVTEGIAAGAFTRESVTDACIACGLPALPGLISRPDLIPSVAAVLGVE